MNIMALDMSLAGTGVCLPTGDVLTLTTKLSGMERVAWIRDRVLGEIRRTGLVDLVVIEGYSFASTGRAGISLGELGGAVRVALYDAGTPYVEIPPTNRAKYATGSGSGSKDMVLQQAVLRSGHTFPDNNGADAWWLWQMGLAHYEPTHPLLVKVPAKNLGALEKVEWKSVVLTRGLNETN